MTDKKSTRGGARPGAGRKPVGSKPKTGINTKVNQECHDNLKKFAKESGHSKAAIIEWAFNKKIKSVPKKLT